MKKRAHIPHNFDISFGTGQVYVRDCTGTVEVVCQKTVDFETTLRRSTKAGEQRLEASLLSRILPLVIFWLLCGEDPRAIILEKPDQNDVASQKHAPR